MAHSGRTIIVTNVTSEGPRLKVWGIWEKDRIVSVVTLIASVSNELLQRQSGLGSFLPDTMCFVNYRGAFVRAKIINVQQNGVVVHLIDSGITDIVAIELVRLLLPNTKEELMLLKCPPLAHEFILANILSVGEKWDPKVIESIRSLIKDKELFVSKFEIYNSYYLVEVMIGDHDVGNLLVNKGMAKMTTVSDMFNPPEMYPQQPTYKVPTIAHQQQAPVPQMPVTGYPSEQQVYHTPRVNMVPMQQTMHADNLHYVQPGYHYQRPHFQQPAPVQQPRISPRRPAVQEESQPEIFEFRTRLVQVGMTYSAFVSCVEDGPIKFSVQLEENRDQLVKLMTELQEIEPLPIKEPPLPGSVCLARLTHENERSLCRAVVMATFQKKIKIYFVDFGNTDYVSFNDIYRLPPKFISPKVLSVRICLIGLDEMNITEEVKTYFSNLIYGQKIQLQVCEPDGPFLIQYGEVFLLKKNVKEYLKERFPDIDKVTSGHIPALTDGTKETVFVSHVVSCSKFFVQLEKNAADLEQLMANINDYAPSAPPLEHVQINSQCIAPYEVDEQWYRVKILKRAKDFVTVLYVDYGNEETVKASELRKISRELLNQMPCQAMMCVLNGFQSRKSKPEFDAAFENLTADKRLSMTVKNAQQTCLIVDLIDITATPPKNILSELNASAMESSNVDDNISKNIETVVQKNQQRDEANVTSQGNTNPFRSNNDENSRNRTKAWKDDHNEQRHDNRYQNRDESDYNGKSSNFNRDGGNNPFGRSDEGNRRDGENNSSGRDNRNERFGNRDGANSSFDRARGGNSSSRDGGRDTGNDRYNGDRSNNREGNDRFKGNDRYNRDGGNDRFNRDGNDRFNRDGNDRFNRDGNDRFNRDGNDRFNRDGNDRFNRNGGSDRYNKDGGKSDRYSSRDGNKYSEHDDRTTRGNKYSSKRDSDNESTCSRGSGKRSDRGGFQGRNDREYKSDRFNKFGNDNDGFNSKPKYGRDNYNEPKEMVNFDAPTNFSQPKTFEFTLPSITLGSKRKGEIVFLTDLSNFYIHLIPDNEKIDQLMDKIAEIYESGGNVLDSFQVKSNVACIAQYAEDDRWYRATIKSANGTNATVSFIDYGNLESISFDKLKEITEEFTTLPIQALSCKLFGSEKTKWTDEEITNFGDMVNDRLLEIEFVAKDQDVFKVILRRIENEVVNPEIINATFYPEVDFTKDGAKSTKASSQQKNAVEFASLDSKWIDQTVTPGTKDTVIVTWFDNPESFYCQSVTKQKEFRPMMEEIQKVYTGRQTINETLKPGYSVMAIFAQDEALYRAEILEVAGNRNHTVQYVDFGNQATVKQSEMFPVEKRFMTLPKQAVLCSLKSIVPVDGGSWTSGNSQEIEQILYDEGEFECTYHEEKNRKHLVSLKKNGADVADSLVQKKHAMFSTSSTPKSTEKITTVKPSSDITSRLDIQLLPGQILRVKVSNVESVSKFHIQFSSADYCDGAISSYMENNDPKVMPRLSSHEMCLGAGCLLFKDGFWRRAVIVNCFEKASCDVKLIDTGAYDKISQDRVLALPSQLAVMQNQAIECALHNIVPSTSLDEKLKNMILNKEVMIYVEDVDKNRLIVELYDSLGCKIQLNDDSPDVKIPPVCPMPILSSTHKVNVSTANHSNSLWLQMVSDADKDEKFNRELSAFYSTNREQAIPEINTLCVVESQGNFCRAQIIKKTADNVLVNLIDYGYTDSVSPDKLKVLDSRFHEPHQLAIHVSLNVTLEGSPAEQVEALKPHLLGKEFTATFYNVHKEWIVELVENGVKLSETLTRLNLVKEVTKTATNETEDRTEKFQVQVSHADSPAQFYIQKIDKIAQLEEFQKELQKAVSAYPAVDRILEEGSICAVNSDGAWYRAEVIDADEEIVTVRFIDYGKTDVINNKPDNIKTLPDSMKMREIFGIKCRLDVIPVDSEDWNDSICQWMQTLKSQKNLEASLIVDSVPKRINLFIDGKSVIDTLVEEGKALKVHHEEELVEEIVDVELDPRSAFICHINSPSDFHVQEEKSVSDLETIQDRLIMANMFSKVDDVKEGELCVAKFTDDDSWYRARVISRGESETKVLFIDYGNNAQVTEIHAIPEDLASIPPLARKCSLQKPYYVSQWPKDAFDTFCELSADGATIFLLDVLQEGETSIVKLTLENQDIAEKLAPPVTVFVCHVTTPMDFCVHKEATYDEIDKMQETLAGAENYSTIEPEEGLLCAAKFPDDELWYRARIVSQNENGTFVFFIDYGNSSACTEIRALPEDLAGVEPFARKCSLQLPSNTDEWSQSSLDDFCTLSGDGAVPFLLDVIEDNETAIVNLFLNGENIIQKLISKKDQIEETSSTVLEDATQQEAESVQEVVPEPEIVPEPKVAPEPEVVSEAKGAPEPEVVSEEKGAPEPEIVPEPKLASEPEVVTSISNVFISQINSIEDFYVQNSEIDVQLDDLNCKLIALEGNSAFTEPKVGSVYAALYPEDDVWYRAKVISTNESNTEVFFIDYGNTSTVTDLRVLTEELLNLPTFAKKCSLKLPSGVSEWPKNARNEFIKLSADGTCLFELHVLQGGDTAIVDLKLDDDRSVTEILLESVTEQSENESVQEETQSVSEKTAEEKIEDSTSEISEQIEEISPVDESAGETVQIEDKVEEKITEVDKIAGDDEKSEKSREEMIESNEVASEMNEDSKQIEEDLPVDENSSRVEETVCLDEEAGKLNQETLAKDDETEKTEDQSAEVIEETTKVNEEGNANLIKLWNIISPSEFWGQMGVDSADIQGQLSQANEWPIVDELKKGLVCAAKVNEEWHRARVESINNDEAEVLLIDQGHTRVCKEFRQLPSTLETQAPLSRKYSLQLPENVDKWSQAAITAFSKYAETSFSMEFLQTGEIPVISLSHHDKDVAEILASMHDDSSSEIADRLPPEGEEKLYMSVCNVNSPSVFWGQTEHDSLKVQEIEKNLENAGNFNPLENFDTGKMCAALFPEDGVWYRAKILSHSDEGTEVFFVDYGNTATVTELRILPHNLISMEYLSTRYSLRKPSDIAEWSEEAIEKFVELTDYGSVKFEYKILDQHEIQLIHQGTDVVELLAPLCPKVAKDQEPVAKAIEVIDLTDDPPSKENTEDTEISAVPVEKKDQDSSTLRDNDQCDETNESGQTVYPELTPEDIIAQMTIDKNDSIVEETISENAKIDSEQKNVCEAEDNLETGSSASLISENQSTAEKSDDTVVRTITSENIKDALPEVQITPMQLHRRKSHDDKLVSCVVSGDQPLTYDDKILSGSVSGNVPLSESSSKEATDDKVDSEE